MKKLVPDLKAMMTFKKLIHGGEPTFLQIFSKNAKLKSKSRTVKGVLSKDIKSQLMSANIEGMGIAMMINEGNARNTKSITKIKAFFCDFDSGKLTKEQIQALPIKPHLAVETSPGKFHAYWLIKDCPLAEFSTIMKALAEKFGGDHSVCDLSRVMRMPGTYNHKYKIPFLAKIIYQQKNAKPISRKVFVKNMELEIDAVPVKIDGNAVVHAKPLSKRSKAEIEEALSHISAEHRDQWLKVGLALHSQCPSDVGLELWIKWAKQSAKFDDVEHRKAWDGFNVDGGVTINSLFWMANLAKRAEQVTFDEGSLAKLYAETCSDKHRYSPETKKWLHFDGVVWSETSHFPHESVRNMIWSLGSGKNESALSSSLGRFKTVAAFKSIISHAELLPEIQVSAASFDNNPNLLAVKNGVVDLTTGRFRQAKPGDLLRRKANVAFDADARYPEWIKFLQGVTRNDKELHFYIRRVMGYILFGRADLQLFFLIIGSGGNGKGVLMRVLKSLLGDYAISITPNLLTTAYSGNANAPSPALAKLNGARYVICTELRSAKLDEAFVKQFAGGDEITARHTYGDVFTFKPEGKLVISANYTDLPEIAADDDAMWRRLIPIPFKVQFEKGKNDDPKLEERLAGEFSGILNWLLKGAVDYHENGLGNCSAVDKTKMALRKEADSLLAWMSKCCDVKKGLKVQASTAFESYVSFMAPREKKALNVQAFKKGLEKKGFYRKPTSKNNVYVGFGLRE